MSRKTPFYGTPPCTLFHNSLQNFRHSYLWFLEYSAPYLIYFLWEFEFPAKKIKISRMALIRKNMQIFWNVKTLIKFFYRFFRYVPTFTLVQRWPTRGPRAACGPKRNFCGPISNWESAIFRNFGCISSVFWCIAAQKVNILGKISKLRPKDQFGLATPALIH